MVLWSLYIVIQEEAGAGAGAGGGQRGRVQGGRGGVTLGGRPEHSFYSWVVTEMMGWARLGSHKEWSDGVEAANIVKYRRIRRPGGPQL